MRIDSLPRSNGAPAASAARSDGDARERATFGDLFADAPAGGEEAGVKPAEPRRDEERDDAADREAPDAGALGAMSLGAQAAIQNEAPDVKDLTNAGASGAEESAPLGDPAGPSLDGAAAPTNFDLTGPDAVKIDSPPADAPPIDAEALRSAAAAEATPTAELPTPPKPAAPRAASPQAPRQASSPALPRAGEEAPSAAPRAEVRVGDAPLDAVKPNGSAADGAGSSRLTAAPEAVHALTPPPTAAAPPAAAPTASQATPINLPAAGVDLTLGSRASVKLAEPAASGSPAEAARAAREADAQQIIRQVSVHVRPNATELRLRLDPPGLGELRIRFISEGGRVRARVRATNGDTAELLRDHESHLRDALRAAGIRVAELDVNDGGARRGALEPKPRGRAAAGRGPSATESDSHAAPAVNSEPLDVLV